MPPVLRCFCLLSRFHSLFPPFTSSLGSSSSIETPPLFFLVKKVFHWNFGTVFPTLRSSPSSGSSSPCFRQSRNSGVQPSTKAMCCSPFRFSHAFTLFLITPSLPQELARQAAYLGGPAFSHLVVFFLLRALILRRPCFSVGSLQVTPRLPSDYCARPLRLLVVLI